MQSAYFLAEFSDFFVRIHGLCVIMVCAVKMPQSYNKEVPFFGTPKLKKQNTNNLLTFCQYLIISVKSDGVLV